MNGEINEEQYICLKLLEKGYMPSRTNHIDGKVQIKEEKVDKNKLDKSKDEATVDFERQTRYKTHYDQHRKSHGNGWYSRMRQDVYTSSTSRSPKSQSRSRSTTRVFIEPVYKIYPHKLPVLQKILDLAYSKKNKDDQSNSTGKKPKHSQSSQALATAYNDVIYHERTPNKDTEIQTHQISVKKRSYSRQKRSDSKQATNSDKFNITSGTSSSKPRADSKLLTRGMPFKSPSQNLLLSPT